MKKQAPQEPYVDADLLEEERRHRVDKERDEKLHAADNAAADALEATRSLVELLRHSNEQGRGVRMCALLVLQFVAAVQEALCPSDIRVRYAKETVAELSACPDWQWTDQT